MKKVVLILILIASILNGAWMPVEADATITDVTDKNLNPLSVGVYEDLVYVLGDGVTAGVDVNLYWDAVKTWDGEKGLLNSTEAYPDGSFEIWFNVPEAVNGPHYLWIKDVDTGSTDGPVSFTVDASVTVTPKSGLVDDEITLKGYGFDDEVDVDDIRFDTDPLTTNPSVPVTNQVGSWEATFSVPDETDGDYSVNAEDENGNSASVIFKIGPAIVLDLEEGSVGTVVEVDARGFTQDGTVTSITLDGIDCGVLDENDLEINSRGEFRFEFVVPNVNQADKEYDLEITDSGSRQASTSFKVLDLAKIELDPQFGAPGSSVDIEGRNFAKISGSDVEIYVGSSKVKTLETNSKGKFSGSFKIPAISSGTYDVLAEQDVYNIEDAKAFRIGTMVVILAPETGPTGTKVSLSGTGFTAGGDWNATFGSIVIFEDEDISGDTSLYGTFYVPTIEQGEQTVTVSDIDEGIQVKKVFTVTGSTQINLSPSAAPKGYNLTIEGKYFAESDDVIEVEFKIFNSTNEWDMEVYEGSNSVKTGEDGEFTSWWMVPSFLSHGDYKINATDEEGLYAQYDFSIVPKLVTIEPYKSSFNRGETVRFDIESSFEEEGSYIMIYDPDDSIVWQTDELNTWIKVDVTYVAPFFTQTAGGNPMTLEANAPYGTWSWTWLDSDDETLGSGIFSVEETTQDQEEDQDGVSDQVVTELRQEIKDLKEELDQVKSDLNDLLTSLDTLSHDSAESINDVASSVDDVKEDTQKAGEDALDAKNIAGEAKNSADEAKNESEKALSSIKNINTMVYVAIGASLIAVILTFIGPVQISRKSAG